MKKIYNNFITYVKKKENYGKVLLGVLILIFLVFTAIYILGTRNVSNIEAKKIDKESTKYINFIDDITESKSKDLDKYIIFALDYSMNNDSKSSLTSKEITKFLKKNLNMDVKREKIISVGITDEMRLKNITYDTSKDIYTLNLSDKTGKDIKDTKIIYYKANKIRKINRSTYLIKYDKYYINNPYDMLNYYIDKNALASEDEFIDTTPIKNYLLGSSNVDSIKAIIKNNEADLKKYAKKKGSVKITFKTKGNKLVIDRIK